MLWVNPFPAVSFGPAALKKTLLPPRMGASELVAILGDTSFPEGEITTQARPCSSLGIGSEQEI